MESNSRKKCIDVHIYQPIIKMMRKLMVINERVVAAVYAQLKMGRSLKPITF